MKWMTKDFLQDVSNRLSQRFAQLSMKVFTNLKIFKYECGIKKENHQSVSLKLFLILKSLLPHFITKFLTLLLYLGNCTILNSIDTLDELFPINKAPEM